MNSDEVFEKYQNVDLFEPFVKVDRFELPGIDTLSSLETYSPEPPEELIQGILRRSRKMLVSGASKAAKTCLLMELAVALASGGSWLGRPCLKSGVLYVNLELPDDVVKQRLWLMMKAREIDPSSLEDRLFVWNLRGVHVPLAILAQMIVYFAGQEKIATVIIDPIYKVMRCDENNANEVGQFCNKLDWIAREGDCAVIFSHHHSKGAKGNRQVLDRSSGSGVFARDPDAILDLIRLEPSRSTLEQMGDERITAWRMEAVLREFPSIDPINCWFRFPLHIPDTEGLLAESAATGSGRANLQKSSKRVSREERESSFHKAFASLSDDGLPVMVSDMAKKMKVSEQTVRNRFSELQDQYWLKNKMIGKLSKSA